MGVGAATAAAAAASAGAQIIGGAEGSGAQTSAANSANNTQQQMFNTVQNNLAPYMQTGGRELTQAEQQAATGFNFDPTQANLVNTPGYKFTLNQGLKSTQNAAAARGLGVSGAAEKGAAQYATGLANNTYQNQFDNALTSYNANFGNRMSLAGIGENAAAGVGNAAVSTGDSIAQNTIGAGNAQAAGIMSGVNGLTNGVNNYQNTNLLQQAIAGQGNNGIYGSAYTPASGWTQSGVQSGFGG